MSLRINLEKTEVQIISRKSRELNVTLDGIKLKQAEKFVYLGGQITEHGGHEDGRRIQLSLRYYVAQFSNSVGLHRKIRVGAKYL